MKRKREDGLATGRLKRQLTALDHLQDDFTSKALQDTDDVRSTMAGSSTASYVGLDDDDASSNAPSDTEITPPTTIARQGTAKSAPVSTSTARSRKFPSELKTIKCTHPGCDKAFNRPARLAAHLRSHNGDRAFKCPHPGCGKDYFEEKHLRQHVKGSHTGERQYACLEPDCGKTFLTATRLKRHAAVHSGEGRFPCRGFGDCDKVFRKHQTLQRHVRADHLGQAPFPCAGHDAACTEGFDSAAALRRHVEREHGELRFWCDECGKGGEAGGEQGQQRRGFTTMALLMAHMRRCHVDCIFCDARLGSQPELERHVELHHSGRRAADRKVVPCGWPGCGRMFTRRANLNVHVRTAHEGRRFVCGSASDLPTGGAPGLEGWDLAAAGCGASFTSKGRLEDHVRYTHLGLERPPMTVKAAVGFDDEEDVKDLDGVAGDQRKRPTVVGGGFFSMFAPPASVGGFVEGGFLDGAWASTPTPVAPTADEAHQREPEKERDEDHTATNYLCVGETPCFESVDSLEGRNAHSGSFHSMPTQLPPEEEPLQPQLGGDSLEFDGFSSWRSPCGDYSPMCVEAEHQDFLSIDAAMFDGSSLGEESSHPECIRGGGRKWGDLGGMVDPDLFLA